MAFGKSSVNKKFTLSLFILAWTGVIFWVGWQAPHLIGGPFNQSNIEIKQERYYPLDRFVISVPGDQYPHYLLLEMALKSSSDNVKHTLSEADPLIRNGIMKMFASKKFEQINDPTQLEPLQKEALTLLSDLFVEHQYKIDLEGLLFTRIVIQ
ncbi:flagellar basal body-associated FliL family protein [Shewanella surugensis]|uniref:Flagellar protein FliL n=1 Tax=Shewanella surugensis TaxID=212020 RepID=A0ABT0LG15_9GAMM|nr:flagellar basal body-associated FliL family protein [Shewanella surugensis]MCL1126504.1 flagellar basal body-associated FliL family protein [Shewanella surugensis]